MNILLLSVLFIILAVLFRFLIMINYEAGSSYLSEKGQTVMKVVNFAWGRFMENVTAVTYLLGTQTPKSFARLIIIITVTIAAAALIFTGFVFLSVLICIAGYFFPAFYLSHITKKRVERLEDQLLDSLILLTNAMKSGLDLVKGIEMIVREMPQPISMEFGTVLQEYNLGYTMEKALSNMRERIDSKVYNIFVTALIIQRETGGNVFSILENVVNTIREKKKLQGRVKALTAQGKMQAWVTLSLPWFMGIVLTLIQPDFTKPFFTEVIGMIALAFLIIWQGIGMVVIRKVTEVNP